MCKIINNIDFIDILSFLLNLSEDNIPNISNMKVNMESLVINIDEISSMNCYQCH